MKKIIFTICLLALTGCQTEKFAGVGDEELTIVSNNDIEIAQNLILKTDLTDKIIRAVLENKNPRLGDFVTSTPELSISYQDVLDSYQRILEMMGDTKTNIDYEEDLNEKLITITIPKIERQK